MFLISAGAVILAATRLSRDGDKIAELTGLGSAWVGAILVAGATSLPELVTDVFAVRNGDVSLAMGDLFGSSMANMMILAAADLSVIQRRLLTKVAVNQLLVGATAISLTTIIIAGVVTQDSFVVLGVGWAPAAAFASYIAAMRILHNNRAITSGSERDSMLRPSARQATLARASAGFVVGMAIVAVAARYLAESSADLADKHGLSQGFVGVAFLALSTSLPEVTVTFDAVRRGSYDLAVGNLFGSCAFNMVIPFFLDIADGSQSVLTRVEPSVTTSGMFAILLLTLTMIEILHKAERRIWLIEPDALLRLVVYAGGLIFVYRAGG